MEKVADHNTWISTPGCDLDKRQCSLQIFMRLVGKQPPLGIVFRGKRKRISDNEKLAWHPTIHVYFQENTLVDTEVCQQLL